MENSPNRLEQDTPQHNPHPQQEMPFGLIQGEPITELPKDLFIPPQALEVFLEAFEGPLDLLLYLIKRQNLDILDIPILEITQQYMKYVDLMKNMQLELAGEYLVMAALLAEIKSRMLLPRTVTEDADESDPRAELIRRLQEYERYKEAAEDLDELPRMGRDNFSVVVDAPDKHMERPVPEVELKELLSALSDVMSRAEKFAHHHIQRETLSVRERMSMVLQKITHDSFTEFTTLFTVEEGKRGVVVTFMAILELIKQSMIEMVQTEPFSPIHVKLVSSAEVKGE
ncbi:MAG: segregation/condensation protein A [Gammaproteobacteria bacterium]|nr:segregation/condensation protein A [Gammaproteobacteria bacterium]MCW8887457.1 segregation/condensation protein A [Gammaproteobacteria bacterium]MCW8983323.1 segregation/condensation protein A [Gammaproteobacteria bacterium]